MLLLWEFNGSLVAYVLRAVRCRGALSCCSWSLLLPLLRSPVSPVAVSDTVVVVVIVVVVVVELSTTDTTLLLLLALAEGTFAV